MAVQALRVLSTGTIGVARSALIYGDHASEPVPGAVWNSTLALHAIKELQIIAQLLHGRIFPGHDLAFWERIKNYGPFYECLETL